MEAFEKIDQLGNTFSCSFFLWIPAQGWDDVNKSSLISDQRLGLVYNWLDLSNYNFTKRLPGTTSSQP